MQRYEWLEDGCPQPPTLTNYGGFLPPASNYVYGGTLNLSNRIYHGLFAAKQPGWTNTLVITTVGDILSVAPSGQVRLVFKGTSF